MVCAYQRIAAKAAQITTSTAPSRAVRPSQSQTSSETTASPTAPPGTYAPTTAGRPSANTLALTTATPSRTRSPREVGTLAANRVRTLTRRNDLGDAHAEVLVNNHHLTSSDEALVDEDVDRFTSQLVQLDH